METVMVTCTAEFKEALGKYATALNQSMSEVARRCIAEGIGYNLDAETKPLRRGTKYATPEERKAAMLERAKARRQLVKKLLAAYERKETDEVIAALQASIDEDES